jgi:hypothetical protein
MAQPPGKSPWAGWSADQSMASVGPQALQTAKALQEAAQAKQAAIKEAAQQFAPKENAKPDQQRAQQVQKDRDPGR